MNAIDPQSSSREGMRAGTWTEVSPPPGPKGTNETIVALSGEPAGQICRTFLLFDSLVRTGRRMPTVFIVVCLALIPCLGPVWSGQEATQTRPDTAQEGSPVPPAVAPAETTAVPDQLFPVLGNHKWGLIDGAGRVVVPQQYDGLDPV